MKPNFIPRSNGSYETYHSLTVGRPWIPGILKRLPWLGILSLLSVLLCAIASALVLKFSDGKPVNSWPREGLTVQPTVLLAILSAVANALLRFAFAEGWAIAWWVKALKGGTVNDLHRYWEYSSLKASMTSGRHFNLVSLATLITGLVIIDGPLLQRASSVTAQNVVRNVRISAPISPDPLPLGYTALHTGHAGTTFLTPEFSSKVMKGYNNRTAIHLPYTGCEGVCSTTLQAPGFDVSCSTNTEPYNLSPNPGDTYYVGSTNITFDAPRYSGYISVETAYKKDPTCSGDLTVTTCTFQTAIVNYPVRLSNSTVILLPRSATLNDTVKIWILPGETFGLGQWPSTLGGIAQVTRNRFGSVTNLYCDGTPYSVEYTGQIPVEYLVANSTQIGTCGMTWTDPTPDILAGIRELMFRSAIAASNSSSVQTALGTENLTLTIYVSNYRFLARALGVMVLGTMLVFPIFLGWWELGRTVSLSPIETAKAFNAPLLKGGGSNADAETLLKEVGWINLVYAEMLESESAESGRISPWTTQSDLDGGSQVELWKRGGQMDYEQGKVRLGMVRPELGRKPRKRAIYSG